MRQKLADFARGFAALTALLVLLVGVPTALSFAVGWPLPETVPSLTRLAEAVTRQGVDDVVIVNALAVMLWAAWAQFALAFIVEAAALVRGRSASRAPTLRAVQVGVAKLVATTALLGSVLASSRGGIVAPSAFPGTPIAMSLPALADAPVNESPTAAAAPEGATYEVQRHDSLWSIAEQTLGDGVRWHEIRDLNVGRIMRDGAAVISTTETIQPGWVLRLPADAATTGARPRSESAQEERTAVASDGDGIWALAERTLETRLGRAPTDAEVDPHWRRMIDLNRSRLVDPANPSLLFEGQHLVVPEDRSGVAEPVDRSPTEQGAPKDLTEMPRIESIDVARLTERSSDPLATTKAEAGDGRANEPSTDEDTILETTLATGMFGVAGATVATGIATALLRRRRRRLLRVPSGSAPPPPPPEFDEVRRELSLAADEDHVAHLNGALLDLGRALADRDSPARPRLVQVGPRQVEALLSATALPGTEEWRVEGGGTVWVSDGTPRGDLPTNSDVPSVLVSLGRGEQSGQLYIDLEAEGVVSIAGDEEGTLDLARAILLELAHSPTRVDVVAVGIDGIDVMSGETLRAVERWDPVGDDLLRRAQQSQALLAANRWPNAFAARAKTRDRDDLTPIVVILREQPEDASFDQLCRLVNTGATTVSVVVTGRTTVNATRVDVEGGVLHMASLGIVCRAQAVDEGVVEQVTELLADAEHLPEQLPLLDDIPVVVSLVDNAVEEEPDVLVRLLGEIDVVGGTRPLTPKQTAVVAYIALHAPVAAERIEDAIWTAPTASRRKRMANTVSECRFALGAEHVPFSEDGRYSVGPRVSTDVELFERRAAFAATRPPEDSIAILRQAVELIRGPVFTYRSLDRGSYVWIDLENWMTTWELKVATAALRLSELALQLDDIDTAVWAAERGLLALPTDSALTEALMKAYRARSDDEAAERVYTRHVAALEELGIDDQAGDTIDLREGHPNNRRTSGYAT